MSEHNINKEVPVMSFSTFITEKKLKTSLKLSTTTDDLVEHIFVNRDGEALGRSVKIRLETPIKSEFGKDILWDCKYYTV